MTTKKVSKAKSATRTRRDAKKVKGYAQYPNGSVYTVFTDGTRKKGSNLTRADLLNP